MHFVLPRMILEIADCDRTIGLGFDIDTDERRANSLHKLDTLASALRIFRTSLIEEFEPYDERARELEVLNG